ncbi:MAG: hypothetical protein ACPGUV_12615 [Polyangiales bacterium]
MKMRFLHGERLVAQVEVPFCFGQGDQVCIQHLVCTELYTVQGRRLVIDARQREPVQLSVELRLWPQY